MPLQNGAGKDTVIPGAPAIGVLDSGVGGLSVLREIHRLLPDYPTLYFADQLHVPYGPRSNEELLTFVDAITRFLLARGARVVVLACHAASAAALYTLRQRYPAVPFVGIEPAVKPAVTRSREQRVGVLTTWATAEGSLYRRVLERFAGGAQVITQVAPELVDLVERGTANTPEGQRLIMEIVQPLMAAGADEIVLACTHFPFLMESIRRAAGPDVELVDPGPAVARQVARVLPADVQPAAQPPRYFTSGDPGRFREQIRRLIHQTPDAVRKVLPDLSAEA
ncbi:MAG: glutamate racemase [Chloroflexota bacterium]